MVCGVCIYVLFNGLDLSIDLGKRRHRSSALQTHLSPNPTAFMHLLLPILRPVLLHFAIRDALTRQLNGPTLRFTCKHLRAHIHMSARAHTHHGARAGDTLVRGRA